LIDIRLLKKPVRPRYRAKQRLALGQIGIAPVRLLFSVCVVVFQNTAAPCRVREGETGSAALPEGSGGSSLFR
jgi:hypothetical protein